MKTVPVSFTATANAVLRAMLSTCWSGRLTATGRIVAVRIGGAWGILGAVDAAERYFSVVGAEWRRAQCRQPALLPRVPVRGRPVAGRRLLDIGAGDGLYSLYAAAAGAERVVALEPEADGSSAGVTSRFCASARRARPRLGRAPTRDLAGLRSRRRALRCALPARRDQPPRRVRDDGDRPPTRPLAGPIVRSSRSLAAMGAAGAKLVASDASRNNVFARLPIRNPLQPTIEWEKHQAPETWARLLGTPASGMRALDWNSIGRASRARVVSVLGNRVAAWVLDARLLPDDDLEAGRRRLNGPTGPDAGPAPPAFPTRAAQSEPRRSR